MTFSSVAPTQDKAGQAQQRKPPLPCGKDINNRDGRCAAGPTKGDLGAARAPVEAPG